MQVRLNTSCSIAAAKHFFGFAMVEEKTPSGLTSEQRFSRASLGTFTWLNAIFELPFPLSQSFVPMLSMFTREQLPRFLV
jgi:hypothetical protein